MKTRIFSLLSLIVSMALLAPAGTPTIVAEIEMPLPHTLADVSQSTAQASTTFDCSTVTGIYQSQCESLVAFYNSTSGDNWTNNTGWLTTNTPCSWYGVTCNAGYVSGLSMYDAPNVGNNISGAIPPEIGNLTSLQKLELPFNQLTGPIPPEIGNLTALTLLNLSNNQISDIVPSGLGNLSELQTLNLQENQLTGTIPPEIGNLSELQTLNLQKNQLTGAIPPEIGALTSLNWLYLGSNQLNTIPPNMGNLTELQRLEVYDNQLSGPIPTWVGNLTKLTSLNLSNNQLSGTIPPEIDNLTELYSLDLSNNQLSGAIPTWIGNHTLLTNLNLSYNQLSGQIPPEIGGYLWVLDLSHNRLSGPIPPNLQVTLGVDLSYNQLSGPIPSQLLSSILAWSLDLSHNQLSGPIPPEIGNLTGLYSLHVHDNYLSGELPASLALLNKLTYFSFHNTNLCVPRTGPIPEWLNGIPNVEGTGLICGECDLTRQPVLLVHGWGGPDVLHEDVMGFAQLYPWIQADGYMEGCNLFYATGVRAENSRQVNRQAISDSLRNAYDQLITSSYPNWRGHLDIIGHSYGGLNARFYLESPLYQEDQTYHNYGIHIDNLFTLGTPHGGAMVLEESYWGAGYIALGHILTPKNWNDFLSAANLYHTAMDGYNFTHQQPDNTCYRLIGGDFLQQDNVPWYVRTAYWPWRNHPGDIGVSLRSSRQLGVNPLLWLNYPRVQMTTNSDMHGYFVDLGLNVLTSFVRPSNTYMQSIKPYLGSRQCPATAAASFDAAASAADDAPFVAPIVLDSAVLNPGQTTTGAFPVNWPGESVFYVAWQGEGTLDFSMTDAQGAAITPAVAVSDPNIVYAQMSGENSGLATYVFTETVQGTWAYTLTMGATVQSVTYTLYANADTVLTVEAFAPEWQRAGLPVLLTATVSAAGTPVAGATVSATVTRPDDIVDTLHLRDDGISPDSAAGDGIYSGEYLSTTQAGFYPVAVTAVGNYQTYSYQRNTATVFSIAPHQATLRGSYADDAVDSDGNGLFDYLELQIGVDVAVTGTLALSARLLGDINQPIDLVSTVQVVTTTGVHTFTLQVAGQKLRNSELDGPYHVTPVTLLDDDTSILLDQSVDGWQTLPYDHQQFDSKSTYVIYLPLVLRQH